MIPFSINNFATASAVASVETTNSSSVTACFSSEFAVVILI
jgi:hypothetical protein